MTTGTPKADEREKAIQARKAVQAALSDPLTATAGPAIKSAQVMLVLRDLGWGPKPAPVLSDNRWDELIAEANENAKYLYTSPDSLHHRLVDALKSERDRADAATSELADERENNRKVGEMFTDATAEIAALQNRVREAAAVALEEAAEEEFFAPYPEDVFIPLTDEQQTRVNRLLDDNAGPKRDRISADMFRRAGQRLTARAATYRQGDGQ